MEKWDMRVVYIGIAMALAGSAGCGLPSPKSAAAKSLGCPQATTEKADGAGYLVVASGCGKKDVLLFDDGKWSSLRERAAFEMSCAANELVVVTLDSTTYGVTGCGHKIVYQWAWGVGIVANTTSEVPAAK